MDRAAVSSEGTSGRPPVSSVERVRANSATWYLRQILPRTGKPMRMPSTTSRPRSVRVNRHNAKAASRSDGNDVNEAVLEPGAERKQIRGQHGKLAAELVIELGELGNDHGEHEGHEPETRATSTQG